VRPTSLTDRELTRSSGHGEEVKEEESELQSY
jgi:hypothetical protein